MSYYDDDAELREARAERRRNEREYQQGIADAKNVQAISEPGSELREQLYRELEQAAYDRGEE